eukprot:TRINITY_DN47672_c0_g1_i1.p1 TRINITY_DN47672_c0_g1~~TRINITY_DN47672_c0_g1_i1.p1  ORF type:complete len:127 (+),score=0.64 TRINITY_DN47672_c0_g1_i1:49-429(+)
MIRQPPRSTLSSSSAASDVYKRQDVRYTLPSHIFTGYAKDCMQAAARQGGSGGSSIDPRELLSYPPRSASLTYSGFLECIYNMAMAAYPFPWMLPSYRLHYLLKDLLERGEEVVPAAFGSGTAAPT